MTPPGRIYVAGHRGLVGSAIVRRLEEAGFTELVLRTRSELDLTDGSAVASFFERERPDYVFLAAARVGGILANSTYPADFIRENLAIQVNVLQSAQENGVERLLFLGSSCIYPKAAPQPMKEEHLLTGPLEPTNEAYAIAKIAGLKMCQAFNQQYGTEYLSVMPTNLYGPGDNFDPKTSHVLPALIRRMHEARVEARPEVRVWGTGTPKRELMYVDDLADACVHLMLHPPEWDVINVGVGKDITIAELAALVAEVVGYEGKVGFDTSKPDGTPRKLLDVSRINSLGWSPNTGLREGVERTYAWYLEHEA